jgi:WD40 repeat protein
MPGMTESHGRGRTELEPRFAVNIGDYISSAKTSPDGRWCVLGAGDGTVTGLEMATGRQLFRKMAHSGGVLGVSISPGSDRFVSCGSESVARIWSAEGDLIRELPGGDSAWVENVAWAPSGGRVAISAGRKLRIWTEQGEPLLETDPLGSVVSSLAWRGDGTAVAASCYGGVHIFPFVQGAKIRHLAWKGSLISLAWSPDAKVVACGSQDSSVHFWRLASGQDSQMSGYQFKPKSLAWDSESKLLATGGDAAITVWDFRGKGPEGTRPIHLQAHKGLCTQLKFSPCKGILASGSQDTSVLLWEPRRGTDPLRYAFLEAEITALHWHFAHAGLLGCDAEGNVAFWNTTPSPS